MSYWNREPEWLPVDAEGTHWQFVSYKGRYLGCVLKVIVDTDAFYMSEKFCCKDSREHRHMDVAACRVETTLYCRDCKRSCLPVSN